MRFCQLPNVKGGIDEYPCYTQEEFPYASLQSLCMKTNRKRKGSSYLTNICSFDIETTTLVERRIGFMYHWQFCIDGHVAYGRTWKEYISFMKKLKETLKLDEHRLLAIYVHNLGFEFQNMKDFMEQAFGRPTIFAAQTRKPIRVNYDAGFEFRCSWKLSNMSLEKFAKNEKGVKHLKQSGDLDYKVIRTPETLLTDKEFAYCIGDVVSLYEAIKNRLINEHDNLETIPMTSTGYVRRDCRKAASKQPGYREMFLANRMTEPVYNLLKEAARGGDTHANRFLANRVLTDVDSYDVQSSYPAMMMLRKFPMTAFAPYGEPDSKEELDRLLKTKACLFRLTLVGVRLKSGYGMPYIPDSKCKYLLKPVCDNGRVLNAQALTITVTDIDYALIQEQYEFDEEYVADIHIAEYGPLPESLKGVIMDYFRQKTELKAAIAAGEDPDGEKSYLYAKSKNRLNGIFGMCFTDPVHSVIEMKEDGSWTETEPEDIGKALDKYNKSRNSFLVYAWGIWVTCHARAHLARLRTAADEERSAYQDTDSCKGHNLDKVAIEQENRNIEQECIEKNAYLDCRGKRYFLGIYEHDASYTKFKTLGAKKYCYEDSKGLHVTISGVNKKKGAKELESMDNFEFGFIFRDAGGLELVYNQSSIHTITVEGVEIRTASNIAALDSTYMLGATKEYMDILGMNPLDIEKFKEKKERHNEKTRRKPEHRK